MNNEELKRCFSCGEDYPKSQFNHKCLCPICEKNGVEIGFSTKNRICEECGIEFTQKAATKAAKFCSRQCYMNTRRAYKAGSPMMRDRTCVVCGKPIGMNRGHNATTCSQECAKIRKLKPETRKARGITDTVQHTAYAKKEKTWKDIIKLCTKLHISYGQYQTLETLGQLDSYIQEHSDLLA